MSKQVNGSGSGAFILGALIGTVIGGVIGLWFAPQSGKKTRHDIEHRAEGLREQVEGPSVDRLMSEAKSAVRNYHDVE